LDAVPKGEEGLEMLDLDQCRQVLGPVCQLSDEELERLRDQLYALADITITAFLERRERHRASALRKTTDPQEGKTGAGEE
jgi:hypothetical protein